MDQVLADILHEVRCLRKELVCGLSVSSCKCKCKHHDLPTMSVVQDGIINHGPSNQSQKYGVSSSVVNAAQEEKIILPEVKDSELSDTVFSNITYQSSEDLSDVFIKEEPSTAGEEFSGGEEVTSDNHLSFPGGCGLFRIQAKETIEMRKVRSRKKVVRPPPDLDPQSHFTFGDKILLGEQLLRCNHTGRVASLVNDLFVILFTPHEIALSNLTGKTPLFKKKDKYVRKGKLNEQRICAMIGYIQDFLKGEMEQKALEQEVRRVIANKVCNFSKTPLAKQIQEAFLLGKDNIFELGGHSSQ